MKLNVSGLRTTNDAKAAKATKSALPTFKQYRERDGKFYFKLVDARGRLLLQSTGFASPKDAGTAIGRLQQGGMVALQEMADTASAAEGITQTDLGNAFQQLQDAALPVT